jgi:ERCC4-type nuclease
MDRFTVIRDTREKDGHGWFFDEDNCCQGTLVQKLDTGDYSIVGLENTLSIERKESVSEIATNIVTERFTKELDRLRDIKHKFLICEFELNDIMTFPIGSNIPKSKWNTIRIKPPFIISCLSNIQVKYNLHIIFAGNSRNAKTIAYNLLKRVYECEIRNTK